MEQLKNTGYSAFGGIILTIIGISEEDVAKTIILGIIGTVVSFSVSALLRRLFRKKQ